jgi:hypothetical protein
MGNEQRFFGLLFQRNMTVPSMDPNSTANPETAALARHILLSVFLETDGFYLAACRLSHLSEATAATMMYALRSQWLELRGAGV